MDAGPIPSSRVVWCFTVGQPDPRLIEVFSRLWFAEGNGDWVIIPGMAPREAAVSAPAG
jgi:hypothetical protein